MNLPHIQFEQLVDLAENRLSAEGRAETLAHIIDCKSCAAQLAHADQIINVMRSDAMEDVPRDVVANAVNLFRSQAVPANPSIARRILAALNFDSAQATPAFGVRSGAVEATRQLLYSAGDTDLDVRITLSGEAWIVSGQVLGECASGGRIELQGASETAQTALNELCEFTLPAVPPGSYTLRLRLPNMEIEVPDLDLAG